MNVIKPCNKCGGIGEIIRVGDWKEYYVVKCSICHYTPVPFDCAGLSVNHAIKEWNKRS